jgi:hypothetical protein
VPLSSISLNRSTPFPVSGTSACCICGRRNGISCGGFWKQRLRTKSSGWQCNGLDRRNQPSLRIEFQILADQYGNVVSLGDRRTPTAKCAARVAYQHVLQRVLPRRFPDFTVDRLSSSMDLERSFGPVYARGLLRRGHSAFAVPGVNGQETQGSIDAALTFGILWLDACRVANPGKFAVEGLKLFLPAGASALIHERMAHLNAAAAKWPLYELEVREVT